MRTQTVGMVAHLAQRTHSRARLLLLALQDGTVIGCTSHDRPIDFDLSAFHDEDDLPLGVVTYRADLGLTLSNIELNCGLQASNYEFSGPIGDAFPRAQVLGGRFDDADAWLFDINWKAPGDGTLAFLRGFTTQLKVKGHEFTGEIQDMRARLNQQLLRVISPQCWKAFASAECGATPTTVEGTVTAAANAMVMSVSFAGTFADNFFNQGKVTGLTGVNAGVVRKIERWAADGDIELFDPLPTAPDVGDTFEVMNGCSKMRISTDPTVPTCKTHNNVVRMGAYPDCTGTKQLQRVAIPGEGDQ